jgi:ribosome-associated toxin RatA of RatAB toxin-antitoxin module
MPSFSRRERVDYSARQMFDLVNDIETYPEFLYWCTGSRVESRADDSVVAALDIGIGGVKQSFRTRNRVRRPEPDRDGRIEMALLTGPFRQLAGSWQFRELAERQSEVALSLGYEFGFSPLGLVLTPLFDEVVRTQIDAFVARAALVYG